MNHCNSSDITHDDQFNIIGDRLQQLKRLLPLLHFHSLLETMRPISPSNNQDKSSASSEENSKSSSPVSPKTCYMLPEIPTLIPVKDNQEMSKKSLFLLGYRDCSYEALRYMIEVEKIAKDDPLILGLQQHLEQHQLRMDIQSLIDSEFGNLDRSDDSEDLNKISPKSSPDTSSSNNELPLSTHLKSEHNSADSTSPQMTVTSTTAIQTKANPNKSDSLNGNCCQDNNNNSQTHSNRTIKKKRELSLSPSDCEANCLLEKETLCKKRRLENSNAVKMDDSTKWSQLNLSIATVAQELIVLLENENPFFEDDSYVEEELVMNEEFAK
ncbi:Hypothetical predicted protein [Octopus vulgaris]|uniref:Uncharacterized protein n=2 Tax=Octopus vulgaris TaxID=6645 RepID=A0AA36ANJ6_OCTVU|nr:Hypothetical predicted protein [Octopus vulgaris]